MRRAVLSLLVLAFLVPPLQPAGAEGPEPAWSIQDDPDDQTVEGGFFPTPGGLTWPANGATSHGDLKRVTIEGETPLGLYVNLYIGPFKVELDPAFSFNWRCNRWSGSSSSGSDGLEALSRAEYQVLFEVPGAPVTYAMRVNLVGGWSETEAGSVFTVSNAYGYLCLDAKPPASGSLLQAADVTLDEANSLIRVWVAKDSLLGVGRDPSPFAIFRSNDEAARPSELNAGDRWTKIEVGSQAYLPVFEDLAPYAVDRAPNEGAAPDYVLQFGAANQRIAVKIGDERGLQSVIAGANQSVPFVLLNKGDSKRIVKLEYALEGEKAASYAVTGPASATVAASSQANLTLALNVPAAALESDAVRLVVRAQSVGITDEVGHAGAQLMPTPALGPGANVLYVHGRTYDMDAFDTVLCTGLPAACTDAFLSPLAKDPTAGDPDHAWMFFFPSDSLDSFQGFFPEAILERGTPAPVAFGSEPIQIDVKMRANAQVENVRLHAMVAYAIPGQGAEGMLADVSATATVGPAGTTFSMKAPVQLTDDARLLPAGTRFGLLLEATVPASPALAASMALGGLEVLGGDSKVTLPLVELPPDQRIDAVASPFQLFTVEDRSGFVNPGEARLYNISLLNQDDEAQDAHLGLNVTPSGWSAELLPGDAFRLQPGDTLRLGVLLHAPSGAKEGENAVVWVNATSGAGRPVSLRLTSVATSGIDLPDDAASFKADEDAQSRLLSKGDGKTPGPGVIGFLAALAFAITLRRRRAI